MIAKSSISLIIFLLLFLVTVSMSQAQSDADSDDGDTTATFPGFLSDATDCTLNILNRSTPFVPGNRFTLFNVPADQSFLRARVTCAKEDGTTVGGQSDFFVAVANDITAVEKIDIGVVEPIPVSIAVTALTTTLNSTGNTTQLTVTGTFPDGTTSDLSAQSTATSYTTSNPAIATVSVDGLVTAGSTSGTAIVSARNEGVLAAIAITAALTTDADKDGLPDDFEVANGLNPNNPGDAALDPDSDGPTNLQEFQAGTSLSVADTDGDGLSDGAEVNTQGTNRLGSRG